MIALEALGIEKHYGGPPVVQGVSISVDRGETVAVIGPNGAGKTTLFSVLAGEFAPTRGTLRLFGDDVTRTGAQRRAHRGIARTFQVARYFLDKSVGENVAIAKAARGRRYRSIFGSRLTIDDAVLEALDAVGLASAAESRSELLSHGDRKNLEIAMALAQEPRVLLLDEPTAGMGTTDIPRTIELIRGLRNKRPELACLITAHDMNVVFALADRIVLLVNGKVALEGSPDEVRNSPLTREVYLGNSYEGGPS